MYKFVFYVAMSFILGIMLGNVIYSPRPVEPTAEECLSVCVDAYEQFDILNAYNEGYDYD